MAITSKPRQINDMKIEFDIPDFKKELKIEITLRKDGETIYSSAIPSTAEVIADEPKAKKTRSPKSEPAKDNGGKNTGGGNMMDIDL